MTDRLRWEDQLCAAEPHRWDGETYESILTAMADCKTCPLLDPCERAVKDMQAAGLDLNGVIAAYPRGRETLQRYRTGREKQPHVKADEPPHDPLEALQILVESIPHGTTEGARQERHNGLVVCRECAAAQEKPLEPCGTEAAYRRHKRNGEPIDDPCRLAHNAKRASERKASA